MSDMITRRNFIKGMAATGAGIYGLQLVNGTIAQPPSGVELAVAQGDIARGADDAELIKRVTREAVAAIGGMSKFVGKKSVVMVKPNIGWSGSPQQAANTNPYVVEAVVEMCREAGAKKVKVLDHTINPARITYERSGIKAAVKRAKGSIEMIDERELRKFKSKAIPEGEAIKSWPIYEDALDVDVLINVPIAKHHSLTKLSLGMKNLMGLIDDRELLHRQIDQGLADLSTVIKPHLIIMDAYRILTANGPNPGRPRDVKIAGQVIAGTDPVAVDSYTTTLFGLKGEDVAYIKAAYDMGLGEIDMDEVRVYNKSVA